MVGLLGFVPTAVVNVPLDDRPDSDGVQVWTRFLARRVPWNHVRAATSLAAAVLTTPALRNDLRAGGHSGGAWIPPPPGGHP